MMFQPFTTLATLPAEAITPGTTNIVVVGFVFVLAILGALALVTSLIGRLFSLYKPAASANTPAVAAATTKPQGESELIPVIAAAVHCAVGERPHRIVSIQSRDSK